MPECTVAKCGRQAVIDLANELHISLSNAYNRIKTYLSEEADKQEGTELAREGNQILGKKHTPAKAEEWNKWWKELNKKQRKLYDRYGGQRPRKCN